MDISLFNWLGLPRSTKEKLAGVFHIKRNGTVHVSDGIVVADGYLYEDLKAQLTLEALQSYTKSASTDLMELMKLAINKVEGKEEPIVTPTTSAPPIVTALPTKRRGRPSRVVPSMQQTPQSAGEVGQISGSGVSSDLS
jgi:hypothetical protein